MKKFNQMTEKQMAKANGGFFWLVLPALACVGGVAAAGAGVAIAEGKKK